MSHKNIIGTFVFRNEEDGCLTSKYFHGNQPYPFVEACKRLDNSPEQADGFAGEYKTVWIQDNHESVEAELKINLQPSNTYTLSWTKGDNVEFEGIGMIYDGLLVGAYWD